MLESTTFEVFIHSFYGLLGSRHTPLMIYNVVIRPKGHNWTAGHSLIPCIRYDRYEFLGGVGSGEIILNSVTVLSTLHPQ